MLQPPSAKISPPVNLNPTANSVVAKIVADLFAFDPFEGIFFNTTIVVNGCRAGRKIHG
jgi:hypothetical protein